MKWLQMHLHKFEFFVLTFHGEVLSVTTDVQLSDAGGNVVSNSLNMEIIEVTPWHIHFFNSGERKKMMDFKGCHIIININLFDLWR